MVTGGVTGTVAGEAAVPVVIRYDEVVSGRSRAGRV